MVRAPHCKPALTKLSGAYVVTMDADLQNDPSDIPMLLDLIKTGKWDLVAGERVNRQDGMLIRKST